MVAVADEGSVVGDVVGAMEGAEDGAREGALLVPPALL